ncbi:MAG TPA: alkaline phosphatase family protein [Candidatus Limnocylindrales bacterium]|nr:alkaline phosphatase family protein [Candidatus Limnocylindrales bacterium]
MGELRGSARFASTIVAALMLVVGCNPAGARSTGSPPAFATASPETTPTPLVTAPPSTSPSATSGIPAFSNVWIIVLENRDYSRVVGADDLPYLTGLIDRYGLAESYHGVARPSQPNYLAMFSGSTHGVTDNGTHDIDAPNVADQIEAAGRTWRQYAENVPSGCFKGSKAEGGPDGPGEYVRKHAPAISFTSISTNPTRCAFIEDFSAFRPGDADYALIIPNECHNAHDCALREADAWLADHVPSIIESDAFRAGGVLFITFDEDAGDDPSGGHVATIVVSPLVAAGTRSSVRYDHYSLLRTIDDAWGLDCLAKACEAKPMADFFATR